MERAGALYGVTLGEDGVSRVLSLRLAEAVRLAGTHVGSPVAAHKGNGFAPNDVRFSGRVIERC